MDILILDPIIFIVGVVVGVFGHKWLAKEAQVVATIKQPITQPTTISPTTTIVPTKP